MKSAILIVAALLVMPRIQHEKQPVVRDTIVVPDSIVAVDSTAVSDTVKLTLRGQHQQKMQMMAKIIQALEQMNGERNEQRAEVPDSSGNR